MGKVWLAFRGCRLELELALGVPSGDLNSFFPRGPGVGSAMSDNASLWGTSTTLATHDDFGDSGFDALPSGYRDNGGVSSKLNEDAIFHTTTLNSSYSIIRQIVETATTVRRQNSYKPSGAAIRCVMDY